jgi:hypothetical protein
MTRVWVRLNVLFARMPGQPRSVVPDGLELTGEVPGLLHGWFQSVDGDWIGVVNFDITYADGRKRTVSLRDQLVPRHALRPRGEDVPVSSPA